MANYAIEALNEHTQKARQKAAKSIAYKRFQGLHEEQARRAVYFSELANAIEELALSNAFERSALSVEPAHPVPPSRLERQLSKLSGITGLGPHPSNLGISLVSLPMVAGFSPESEAATLLKRARVPAPLYLLDHLYGFVFFLQRDGIFHNHCLALDFWQSRRSTMPESLAAELWKNRADNLLSGGAFSGRLIFKDLVPPEPNDLKRSQVPDLVVRSESHLLEIVSSMKSGAASQPNIQLWFRGQGSDYQVPNRTRLLASRVAPYSNIQESSLIPSIYRSFDAHLESFDLYERLLGELTTWVDAAQRIIPHDVSIFSKFRQQNPHALSEKGLTSFQRGLILQQYGAPSAYLDITSEPLTAAWFAVHECQQADDGTLTFTPRLWKDDDETTWPTIFVFPLVAGVHPFLDLSSILPNDLALRPKRQSCGLIGGAGNLARNYCARYLGLKLRLHPEFRLRDPVPVCHLFPSDAEDPVMPHLRSLDLAGRGRRYPLTSVSPNR